MGIGTTRSGRANGVAVGPRTAPGSVAGMPVVPTIQDGRPASALAVLNYAVVELQSAGAVGGLAEVRIPSLPGDLVALVDRIFISCDSGTATTAGVFVGGTSVRNQRDHAPSGNVNVADLVQPIYVPRNQPFIIRWEGASDGAVGIATVQYRICEERSVSADSVAGLV